MKTFVIISVIVFGLAAAAANSDVNSTSVNAIMNIAQNSACNQYSWKNRGRAPAAYINGMAISFAKSLCRLHAGESTALLASEKNTENTSKDALAWYETTFSDEGLNTGDGGADTLRSLFTLGIGLGMRESSGQYCEGFDVTAGPETASEAEAGTFQTSFDSMSASPQLQKLYTEYRNDPSKCYLNIFAENVSCKAQGIVGTGAGADFQTFVKSCPAFGAEYAMMTLRVLRKHFGPINRKEAEVNPSCNKMLDDVQNYVESSVAAVCGEL